MLVDFTGTDFSDPKTGIHTTVLLEDAFKGGFPLSRNFYVRGT